MADGVKISQLPGASTPSDSDVVSGVQNGTTKKFSFANIYAWLKSRLVPEDIGAVPDSRTVNGKALSSDISLTASDVGARGNDWMPTAAQVGARPDTWTPSAQDVGAVPVASVGVAGGVPNLDEIGRVPQNQLPPYPTVPTVSTANPQMDGTASPGSTGNWADGGHVHPTDTTRVPTSRTINGYNLTQDRSLTAADVGALADDGTAVAAGKLANAHEITAAAAGWYKFLTITMDTASQRQTMIIAAENRYGNGCGLLRIHTRRNSSGNPLQTIGWIAAGNATVDVRWEYADGTWTFYAYKGADPNRLCFQVISKTDDNYGTWLSVLVAEPTTATEASDTVALTAKSGLWFTSVAVSAGTSQQIIAISDAAITTDYVLARIEWADPSYITDGFTWTTASGSLTISGTATAATTANVLLLRRSN